MSQALERLDTTREVAWLVGCFGYPEQRQPESTPVFRLHLDSFAIHPVVTDAGPGWIHEHRAELSQTEPLW